MHLRNCPVGLLLFQFGGGVIEVHVEQHHIGPEPLDGADDTRGRGNRLHLAEVKRQQNFESFSDAGIVVDDKYLSAFLSHNRRYSVAKIAKISSIPFLRIGPCHAFCRKKSKTFPGKKRCATID